MMLAHTVAKAKADTYNIHVDLALIVSGGVYSIRQTFHDVNTGFRRVKLVGLWDGGSRLTQRKRARELFALEMANMGARHVA